MIGKLIAVVLLVGAGARAGNLFSNESLEEGDKRPTGWSAINFWGGKASFDIESRFAHTGRRSFRISCAESTQAFLFSAPVPVAAGETLHASAWVKVKDRGALGDVVLVANFFEGDGRTEDFTDVAKLKGKGDEWTQLSGEVKVPQRAAVVRLRIGLRDVSGACWVDDVTLTAKQQLVARADLRDRRITPEMGGVPVLVINRSDNQVAAAVQVRLGKAEARSDVRIPAATTQRVVVPVQIMERKTLPLEVALYRDRDDQPLFVEKRNLFAPPEMVLSPPIPTHWAVEDGVPGIEGDVDLAVTEQQRESSRLLVKLVDGEGKSVAESSSNSVSDGFNHFSLKPAASLPVAAYRVVATLEPKSGKAIKAEQPFGVIHREESKIVLNQNGYLEHRGKPIFPLGIFNGPAKVSEMGEAGFTVNHAYNAANAEIGERPDDAQALAFINETQKNGMMALFLIPRGLAFGGDWENFRRRIRMFKNHPALLAWDEEEGLARGDMDTKALATMRKIIAEEDPHHPFMVGDSRDVITKVKDRSNFFPLDYMDLGMWWWYPIPAGGGREASVLEGDEYSKALELVPPSFLTQRNTDKPIWVGVQSYKKPKDFGRYSTPAEYRAQAYISIIHGAKGLMWYGGSVEGGIYLDPKAGNWDYLKKLARELNGLSNVFMGEMLEAPKFTPADAPISVGIKRAGNRVVMMAVNRDTTAVEIKFAGGALKDGKVKVLQEDREMKISGTLTDRFKAYETHVYEWN